MFFTWVSSLERPDFAQLGKKHEVFCFRRQLLDTTLTMKRMKNQEMKIFNKDGTVRETELKIMNFRPMGTNKNSDPDVLNKQWEEVVHFFLIKGWHS